MPNLWDYEDPISELLPDIEIPPWIEQDISPNDVAAICQGGCASGAYMPACVYATARETMNAHGDDVLDYIEDHSDDLPAVPEGTSWSGMACHFLSYAVELWASSVENELDTALEEKEADEEIQ